MPDEQQIDALIEMLERLRKRITMYIGPAKEERAQLFLSGFAAARHALGIELSLDLRREATYSRGWTFPAVGPVPQMRERGLTEMQIIDELLLVEIEALKLLKNSASRPTDDTVQQTGAEQ